MASREKARSGLPIIHKTIESLRELYKKNPFLFVLACILVGIAAVVIVAFFIFILISFVFLPVGSRSAGLGQRAVFGYYDGKPIEYKQGNYFSQMVKYLSEQEKAQNQNPEEDESSYYFKAAKVWRQAFENSVVRTGILAEAGRSGLTVSPGRLDKEMMEQPQYQENGQFSLKAFKSYSDSARSMARESLKESLLIQDYSDLIQDSGDQSKLVEYVRAANSLERTFTFVSFPFNAFPDSEIKAYGQKNASLFRGMKVSYIRASESKSLAQALLKGISSGKQKFSEAISAAKDKGYSGVENVDRAYWEIKDLFEDEKDAEAVFALAKDAYSPVMETKDGEWIFFLCQEAAVEPDFSLLDQSSKVWTYIQSREKGLLESYCMKRAEDFNAKASVDFDAACKEFGVTAAALKPFPINYGAFPLLSDAEVGEYAELAGIQSNEAFLTAAFSLKKGELSKPLVVSSAVAVLRLDEEKMADQEAMGGLDYYIDYYLSQYSNQELNRHFIASPKFKDQFGPAFTKFVMPSK